jgi:hypothetical protein
MNISETQNETVLNPERKNETVVDLQLGDVIHIENKLNDNLDNKDFIIDYIDPRKIILIDVETMLKMKLTISDDGILGDGNITKIAILSRSDSPSYAVQNGLTLGKWINVYFGGEIPVIIVGEITNLENDMIEIKTVDDDVIYINFDYKGIPENLPIELIEIREKPSSLVKDTEIPIIEDNAPTLKNVDALEDLHLEQTFVEPEKMQQQIQIPVKAIKDQIREVIIKADQVQFGEEEFGPIVQFVDVSTKSQRYSIETQVSDLLDELLSTIPNSERTSRVLNNIHIMIERFKQLRQHFSTFDGYGNIEGFIKKGANYKPLSTYFYEFNQNLYWIMPVVKNIKKIYNATDVDEENSDLINLDFTVEFTKMRDIIKQSQNANVSSDQTAYANLYSELNPFFTPFNYVDNENASEILIEKNTNANINSIIDNLTNMYSSVFNKNVIKTRKFVIQKYNTALTKLNVVESTGYKMVSVRTNITENDTLSIKSFLTLPEPFINFSRINLPNTNIMERSNLNRIFMNYWKLLKSNTNVNTIIVDDLENELELNEASFANNIKNIAFNVDNEAAKSMSKEEIYSKFIQTFVPKIRVVFNLMKKYITGKLSIVNVVSYLEPFLIYADDLTFNQYKIIIEFINQQISLHNKNLIAKSRLFKDLTTLKSSSPITTLSHPIIEIIHKNLSTEIFEDGYGFYEPLKHSTNSEVLKKMMMKDNGKLYASGVAYQNIGLMFPANIVPLLEDPEKVVRENDPTQCKTTIIAKYYNSLEALNADNDKLIYFDKKYDKTNYDLLETTYEKQVLVMSPDELREYIKKDLTQNKRMKEGDAEYLAETLVDGYKRVIDGQYAILYKGYKENVADEVEYYVRKNNKWTIDPEMNAQQIVSSDQTILCDAQTNCIQSNDECVSSKEMELSLQTKMMNQIMSEFDTKYKISNEEMKKMIETNFQYNRDAITLLNKIDANLKLKYNNQKYNIGLEFENEERQIIVSPFQSILNLILGQDDFVKKQGDIIKFCNAYTRKSVEGLGPLGKVENQYWLYCIKTNVPLVPSFKLDLASVYVSEGQYKYYDYLQQVISKIGKLSDDGDWWCDQNSGWTICPVNFDVEEGYEDGFKIQTRGVIEEDAGNKLLSALNEKGIKYTTPETKMINNMVNTLSLAMGINMELQKEFIINTVLSCIKNNVESETDYKRKVRQMAEKGKKIMAYKDFFNSALLYFTLGSFLIACQTAIPSIKTRKTHPGCVRSFEGYPFEGTGDFSSLTYLGCVIYDIRESGEPYNVLKGKKQEYIIEKIKNTIDSVLLSMPEVKRKMEDKTNYLLTNPSDDIPTEHDITKWKQFLPPLIPFKLKHLTNISNEFKKSLLTDLRNGSIHQRDKLCVVNSKIIMFSIGVIERIQEVVKRHKLLLHSANNQPYLENACCETNSTVSTIHYFKDQDPLIEEYNKMVSQLTAIMEDVNNHTKSGIFYSKINTKNVYPTITNEYSEKTIYQGFITYCKFKSLMPIPTDLLPYCTNKPEPSIMNPANSLDRLIQLLKEDDRIYKNEHFLRILQIISQHNLIPIEFNKIETSPITRLINVLDNIDDEDDEVVDKALRELMHESLDTFDIAAPEYTKEVKKLNNYLSKQIENMKNEIIDFVQKNAGKNLNNSAVRKMTNVVQNLSIWSRDDIDANNSNAFSISDNQLYKTIQFYKTFIDNFVNVFPTIILNKVNYNNVFIPKHYEFTHRHEEKLKEYIALYYEKLRIFYEAKNISKLLVYLKRTTVNLDKLAKCTPVFSNIVLEDGTILKPVFDDRTSMHLFEFYLLRCIIQYIDLSDLDDVLIGDNVVTRATMEDTIDDIFSLDYLEDVETRAEIASMNEDVNRSALMTGNKKELRQSIAKLISVYFEMLNNEKDTIDVSYKEVEDRVFKLKEKEKDRFTDKLKSMSDELRDADTILKINKLGDYSIGMQKGLTMYDKDFYEKEEEFREQMNVAERNIRKTKQNINDDAMDILIDEYLENQQSAKEIEDEVYDMEYMNETYFDGNTDGVSAPEEEYQDYADDY